MCSDCSLISKHKGKLKKKNLECHKRADSNIHFYAYVLTI